MTLSQFVPRLLWLITAISIAALSLAGGNPGGSAAAATSELPLPAIPDTLQTRTEKISYLLSHFWDAMDWADFCQRPDTLYLEQNLSNFFSVVALADSAEAASGVKILLERSGECGVAGKMVRELAKTYLYTPRSPYFNAESYLVFADYLRRHSENEAERARADYARSQILKNRVGDKASDFRFIDLAGRETGLYELEAPACSLLLIFYDTDCEDCHRLMRRIAEDQSEKGEAKDRQLKIVAIDAYGSDYGHWQKMAAEWPEEWVLGWSPDGEIDAEEIYVLPSAPTLYLLDPELRVVAYGSEDLYSSGKLGEAGK